MCLSLVVVLVFGKKHHCQKIQIFDQCQETGAEKETNLTSHVT